MTTHTAAAPAISTLVEMTTSDEPVRGVRIDEIAGTRIVLSPPASAPVRVRTGESVTLRWAAGERGRYVVTGEVVQTSADRLVVEMSAAPVIEQHRQYVRGGGGEQVRLHRLGSGGSAEHAGWIRDVSERGIRAAFPSVGIDDGDPLRLTIHLDDDTIEVLGTVSKITVRPPEAPGPAATAVEVVALFDADEAQAQIIRRYVLRQQLLTRTRTAG
jgi:hypothetical protein